MYQIDFKKPQHIHFIGIGGISMSGLAEILMGENFKVTGSDNAESSLIKHLEGLGAKIEIGQSADNIPVSADVVVYTAAIRDGNPELEEAKRLSIPLLTRAELLGQIMKNYKLPIAVAGTHGKTTTTSMLSQVLLEAELDPTITVGGIMPTINGNIRVGKSDYFVTEACEYTNSFLSFLPKIAIILNAEEDHMDFFKDLDDILNSFHRFAALIPEDGSLIINGEIDKIEQITNQLKTSIITYGLGPSYNYSATNISFGEKGKASFDLIVNGQYIDHIQLSVVGEHNISNALSVFAVCDKLNIPLEQVKKGLLAYSGTNRRFQYKGTFNGFTIIDDYAHHPTEIRATLSAARSYPHNELWCVFQPHTYTRTKTFFKEFAAALSLADHVVLTDIYSARETDTLGVSSKDLADELIAMKIDAHYLSSFEDVELFMISHCKKNDLMITMGAGDVVNIGESILSS